MVRDYCTKGFVFSLLDYFTRRIYIFIRCSRAWHTHRDVRRNRPLEAQRILKKLQFPGTLNYKYLQKYPSMHVTRRTDELSSVSKKNPKKSTHFHSRLVQGWTQAMLAHPLTWMNKDRHKIPMAGTDSLWEFYFQRYNDPRSYIVSRFRRTTFCHEYCVDLRNRGRCISDARVRLNAGRMIGRQIPVDEGEMNI